MKLFLATLLIVIAALAVHAQKVRVGADPAVDVSKYKTYAWSTGTTGTNAIINQQIVAAVDSQLAAKGLTKVETDPELTISALVWTESDAHVTNPSWHPSLNSISTGIYAGAQSWPVTKGTLLVSPIPKPRTKSGVARRPTHSSRVQAATRLKMPKPLRNRSGRPSRKCSSSFRIHRASN
jgi:hypothetical protein